LTATTLLTHQHELLLAILDAIERDTDGARVALLLELIDELTAHITLAAYFVYGVAGDATGIPLDPYVRAHATLKSALREVLHAEPDEATFRASLAFLRRVLAAHARAEEGVLFPATERAVPLNELDEIGAKMKEFYAAMRRTGDASALI
jgi:hypothetical protein